MKIEIVGFDYGNTLVSDPFEKIMKLKGNDFVKIMEKSGYEITKKKLIETWTKINAEINYPFCSHFAQELPLIKELVNVLEIKKNDKIKVAQSLLIAYRSGLKQILKNDKKMEKVRFVLHELKKRNKKLFIISNERVHSLTIQLRWTKLHEFFDKIIVSEKFGIEKPDLRLFQKVLKYFDTKPEKVAYVGDDPERDIKPAKAIGIKAILLDQPKEMSCVWRSYNVELKENEKPDFVIKDLSELLKIIE
ncbi:MAG: HAD family hydrolase [Candidatus Aenigmatarchaeota archaeon]